MPNANGISETKRHPDFYIPGGDLYLLVSLLSTPPGIQYHQSSPASRILTLRFVWGISYGWVASIKHAPQQSMDTPCCRDVWGYLVSLSVLIILSKVENIHFCVPSYFFTREPRSEFRELLKPSPSPGATISGRNHANALLLTGVKSEDINTFLKVVLNPKYTDFSFMTLQNWITVLLLAHKWKLNNLIEAVILELRKDRIDIISRVELYRKNAVDIRYILPWYADLCQMDGTALTLQESKRVGPDATYTVMQARETMLTTPAHFVLNRGEPRSPVPSRIPRTSIFGILKKILDIDFEVNDHPDLNKTRVDNSQTNAQTANVNPNSNSQTPHTNKSHSGGNSQRTT